MRSTTMSRTAVLAAAATIALFTTTSCSTTSQSVGIESVDSLVSRVERVHLEVELSKQSVYNTLISLGPLMADEFAGDPAEAFAQFAIATEECENQANELRRHVAPMRNSAEGVFERWQGSMDEITSPRMRERSAARLDATRDRFADVYEAAAKSQEDLDAINVKFRDLVLFLGHDFNTAAVLEIREDAFEIRDEARALGLTLDDCMDAAAIYVEKSALRGQIRSEVDAETTVNADD